nr:hypothetical protein [Ferruginibacter sp.]
LFFLLLSCNNGTHKEVDVNTVPNSLKKPNDSIAPDNIVIKKDTLIATATLLSKAFSENEISANKQYKDQIIKVSGTIKQINVGISDKAYIVLKGVDRFTEPFCYLSHLEDAEKLKTGDNVTFIGECTGLWANLIFKDCKLIKTQ